MGSGEWGGCGYTPLDDLQKIPLGQESPLQPSKLITPQQYPSHSDLGTVVVKCQPYYESEAADGFENFYL